jgi:hypothetical protein
MLRYIPPELLDAAWPIIAPGLAKVTDHSFDPDLPQQVKAAIGQGAAHLFVAFCDKRNGHNDDCVKQYAGFVVIRPEIGFTGNKSLHLWAAYSENSGLDERLAEVEQMAREQGFGQVTFSSPRKGWSRRLKSFQPTYQVYKKVLTDER